MSNTPARAVRVDDATWNAALARARSEHRALSDIIRIALRTYADHGYDGIMAIGTKTVSSMVAQITRGVDKSDSHLVTDAETAQMWDKLAADHVRLMAANPGATVEIPNDPDI